MKSLPVLLSVAALGLGAFGVALSLSTGSSAIVAAPPEASMSPELLNELRALREETSALAKQVAALEMRQSNLEGESSFAGGRQPAADGGPGQRGGTVPAVRA